MQILNEKLWNWASILDEETQKQAEAVSRLPIVVGHVCLLPDAHVGVGAVVGSCILTEGAIAPGLLGVDLHCGVLGIFTDIDANSITTESAQLIYNGIAQAIPDEVSLGSGKTTVSIGERDTWYHNHPTPRQYDHNLLGHSSSQIGTLGSGNHFIEVVRVQETGKVAILVHSGSRGIGNTLATEALKRAKEICKKDNREIEHPDLSYFLETDDEFWPYIADVKWCGEYAKQNRIYMGLSVWSVVNQLFSGRITNVIHCVHNYTAREVHEGREVWTTRKGAISARSGELGVIPGSMTTYSYVVMGKGSEDSYQTSSHGAGRLLSRTKAKLVETEETLSAEMTDAVWGGAEGLTDEGGKSYKDVFTVMNDQTDLTTPIQTLRRIVNYKWRDHGRKGKR